MMYRLYNYLRLWDDTDNDIYDDYDTEIAGDNEVLMNLYIIIFSFIVCILMGMFTLLIVR